jgi:hypothetical protein
VVRRSRPRRRRTAQSLSAMLAAWLAVQLLKFLLWLQAGAVIIARWPVSAAAGVWLPGRVTAWLARPGYTGSPPGRCRTSSPT